MVDVVAIGEALIDFSPAGVGPMGNPCFEMNPGGAPLNCVAANVRLGGSGAFIGAVGKDFFGRFLERSMRAMGIAAAGLRYTEQDYTTIDFVSNAEDGEREFAFFRNPGADSLLYPDEVELTAIRDAKILHFGSVCFTREPSRSAVLRALEVRKDGGGMISYDPNYRADLWSSPFEAVREMRMGIRYADILKVSLEELQLLSGMTECPLCEQAQALLEQGVQYLFVTEGARGASYFTAEESGYVKGFQVDAIDTTGCGDAFLGAILYQMSHEGTKPIGEMVRFANAVGALCATRRTGFAAMPAYAEVLKLLATAQ